METNFLGVITDWIKGNRSPKIDTVIALEDATLNKTALYLLGITSLFLGGLKIILDSSLKKHARYMGATI
jgi:hypothetical protein